MIPGSAFEGEGRRADAGAGFLSVPQSPLYKCQKPGARDGQRLGRVDRQHRPASCDREPRGRSRALVGEYPKGRPEPHADSLRKRTGCPVSMRYEPLTGPTEFGEIYEAAVRGVSEVLTGAKPPPTLTFHFTADLGRYVRV